LKQKGFRLAARLLQFQVPIPAPPNGGRDGKSVGAQHISPTADEISLLLRLRLDRHCRR
jgi:hypothetical protein